MRNELIEYRNKLKKFNKWEINYSKNTTIQNRLNQFEELFNLIYELPDDVREKGHSDHLQNLISVQKKISKIVLNKKGNE